MAGDQCQYAGMHIARLNCERAIGGFELSLLKTEPVSSMSVRFQLISAPGLSLLVHTSVIPASVCPAYQLDHQVACRWRDAF